MPFAEVTGGVTGSFECLGDGFFLASEGIAMVEHARSIIRAAGEDGGSSGGTVRCPGIKTVELKPIGGHCIEMRGFEMRVVGVTGLSPSLVVRHDQNDMRSRVNWDWIEGLKQDDHDEGDPNQGAHGIQSSEWVWGMSSRSVNLDFQRGFDPCQRIIADE